MADLINVTVFFAAKDDGQTITVRIPKKLYNVRAIEKVLERYGDYLNNPKLILHFHQFDKTISYESADVTHMEVVNL